MRKLYNNLLVLFSQSCPDCAAAVDDPNLFALLSTKDLYYPDGTFSPVAMDDGLNAFYNESRKNGKRHIRASAEMVWALEAIMGMEHFMAYESRLNYFIPGKPWISLCPHSGSDEQSRGKYH